MTIDIAPMIIGLMATTIAIIIKITHYREASKLSDLIGLITQLLPNIKNQETMGGLGPDYERTVRDWVFLSREMLREPADLHVIKYLRGSINSGIVIISELALIDPVITLETKFFEDARLEE